MKSKIGCAQPAGAELRLEIIYYGRKDKNQTMLLIRRKEGEKEEENYVNKNIPRERQGIWAKMNQRKQMKRELRMKKV